MNQTEIPIPDQPPETSKFKRGDTVYWAPTTLFRARKCVVIEHYEFKNSYRIQDSRGEAIVMEQDIMTEQELHEAVRKLAKDLQDERDSTQRIRLSKVVFGWKSGLRTAAEFASKFGGPAVKWYSQIKAAKRRNLING